MHPDGLLLLLPSLPVALDQLVLDDPVVRVADDQLASVGTGDGQVRDAAGVIERFARNPTAPVWQEHLPASPGWRCTQTVVGAAGDAGARSEVIARRLLTDCRGDPATL